MAEKVQRRSTKNVTDHTTRQSELAPALQNQISSRRLAKPNPPVTPPSLPTVDQAVCFFFRSHVTEASEACRQVYNYLPSLYGADQSSALSHTIKAIGLAGLSNYKRAPKLMSSACKQYTEALRLIGISLRDPMLANNDQVLLVVHLMAIYEVSLNPCVTTMTC